MYSSIKLDDVIHFDHYTWYISSLVSSLLKIIIIRQHIKEINLIDVSMNFPVSFMNST